MPRLPILLLIFFSILLHAPFSASAVSPKRFVSLRMRAAWPSSSFAIEAAYAIAEFDTPLFWSFVSDLSSNASTLLPDADDPSPQLLYNSSMATAAKLLPAASLSLLSASLALRRLNPRATMLQSLCAAHAAPSASSPVVSIPFLHLLSGPTGIAAASARAVLEQSIKRNDLLPMHMLLSSDLVHSDPNSPPPSHAIVLYSNIISTSFADLHAELIRLAAVHGVAYVLRVVHTCTSSPAHDQPLWMQGYGVELAVKNMEYKSIDDKKVTDEHSASGAESSADVASTAASGTLAGLDFDVLNVRYPDHVAQLKELADSLQGDTIQDLQQEVKVWAIRELGLQAVQAAHSSSQPLNTLRELAHNLPARASALSRTVVSQDVRSAVANVQQMYQPGSTHITLNNRIIDPQEFSPFSLVELLSKDTRAYSRLESLGVPHSTATRLLTGISLKTNAAASSPRVDLTVVPVEWLNNLTSDSRYSNLPRQLSAIAEPTFNGYPSPVAHNVVSMILVANAASAAAVYYASMMPMMVKRNVPVRFGAIFYSDSVLQASPSLDNALADPPYNVASVEDASASAAVLGSSDYVDQSTAFALAFASLKQSAVYNGSGSLYSLVPAALALLRRSVIPHQELAEESERKAGQSQSRGSLDDITWTLPQLEAAVLQAIGRSSPAKNPATNAPWPVIKSLADVLACSDAKAALKKSDDALIKTSVIGQETKAPLLYVNGMPMQIEWLSPQFDTLESEHHEVGDGSVAAGWTGDGDQVIAGASAVKSRLLQLILTGKIDPQTSDVYAAIMASSSSVTRHHPDLARGGNSEYVQDFDTTRLRSLKFHNTNVPDTASASSSAPLSDSPVLRTISHIVYVDPMSPPGRLLLIESFKRLNDPLIGLPHHTRVAIVCSNPSSEAHSTIALADALLSNLTNRSHATLVLHKVLLQMQTGDSFSAASAHTLPDLLADSAFSAAFAAAAARAPLAYASAPDVFGSRSKKNRNAVVTNGRIVHAHAVRGIESHDFALFESVAWAGLLEHADLLPANEDDACAATMLVQSIVGQELAQRIVRSSTYDMPISPAVSRFGDPSSASALRVVVDPLSSDAQRIIPIVTAASSLPVSITLILNPTTDLTSVPLKAFFRYVWNVSPTFDSTGGVDVPLAVFSGLPSDNVLTLAVHPIDSWMVTSSSAPVDLDNIRLSDLGSSSTLAAEYTLDKLVITGHCVDESYRPPQGLQLNLDTPDGSTHVHDTLVMSNLGHFQLQALPGAYSLSLADGRSSELYDIMQRRSHVTSLPVQVDNINSQPVHLHVHKKPDKMALDLLHREEVGTKGSAAQASTGIWGSIVSAFGGKEASATAALDLSVRGQETIHVFSLATGHLYERFLKIMMLAVTRNTNAPVKFWLLGNFVSPQFKRALPLLAKHWGYTYEFVTYKWPSWLNRQTEKQRIIWAYKVLFLDVLFPLHVKKIIYIDSDQVVRADLRELWHMDLKGAPLAYTPFCDSNKDIEGFRFWKTGFWKSHLQGRNYHISALYVVDLERFRQLAAGDSWRIIYDQLSRDPNSLSNLDQDLPNYSQQQVRIFSLPQEWLWCETWCSLESKPFAKTIDLCNNPMTKEPKLDQARRVISEWETLDGDNAKAEAVLLQQL